MSLTIRIKPRGRAIGALVAVALATTLAACSSSGAGTPSASETGSAPESTSAMTPIHVNFGYIGDFNGTSLLAIADKEGIWAKHGLDVTTSVFTNGPLQIQAIGTGDLDFGYIGPGAFWLPMSGQSKIVMLNTLTVADRVIAQPGITSIQDLRGKTVGYPEGTSGDMILTLALQSVGMTKDDIEAIAMDAATLVPAFSAGQVDAAAIWYPAISTIKTSVPNLVELAKNSDFQDVMAFATAFVAGNDVVANDTEKVTRTLAALKEAMQWRTDNPDEAIQQTADMLGLDAKAVAADAANQQILSPDEVTTWTTDGTVDRWMTAMGAFFVSGGKLTSNPDLSTYYTGDLFVAAK